MPVRRLGCVLLFALGVVARAGSQDRPFIAFELKTALDPEALAAHLHDARVVFVGETHTRFADHLHQLAIIQQLAQGQANVAIGVEYFPTRLQPQIDDYIEGRTTEQAFLRDSDYFGQWGYDYRLYAPIFRYARQQGIPVRALNVPGSLVTTVAQVGLTGLSGDLRRELPRDIEPASADYRARLRTAFAAHQDHTVGAFDHFVEAQLVWDEGMAESAAAYLEAHPDHRMVILAGSGHLASGSGIPQRLARRTHLSYAVVLNADDELDAPVADYVLLGGQEELPPAGVLGATLQDTHGVCRLTSLSPGGAAQQAGLLGGDILIAIDDQPIKGIPDVRLALWDKKPGDRLRVEVRRTGHWRSVTRRFDVQLTAGASEPQVLK